MLSLYELEKCVFPFIIQESSQATSTTKLQVQNLQEDKEMVEATHTGSTVSAGIDSKVKNHYCKLFISLYIHTVQC